MIDTNVVIDLLDPEKHWFAWSSDLLADAKSGLSVSAIVVGELAATLRQGDALFQILEGFGMSVVDLDAAAAFRAGRAQAAYRAAGGSRQKLLADFLIGAHAETRKVPLATRDPKPYRRYFPELKLIAPETENG